MIKSHIFAGLPVAKRITTFIRGDMEMMFFKAAVSFDVTEASMKLSTSTPGKPSGASTLVCDARHAFCLAQYRRGYTAIQIAFFLNAQSTTGVYSSIKKALSLLETDPEFKRRFETLYIDNL